MDFSKLDINAMQESIAQDTADGPTEEQVENERGFLDGFLGNVFRGAYETTDFVGRFLALFDRPISATANTYRVATEGKFGEMPGAALKGIQGKYTNEADYPKTFMDLGMEGKLIPALNNKRFAYPRIGYEHELAREWLGPNYEDPTDLPMDPRHLQTGIGFIADVLFPLGQVKKLFDLGTVPAKIAFKQLFNIAKDIGITSKMKYSSIARVIDGTTSILNEHEVGYKLDKLIGALSVNWPIRKYRGLADDSRKLVYALRHSVTATERDMIEQTSFLVKYAKSQGADIDELSKEVARIIEGASASPDADPVLLEFAQRLKASIDDLTEKELRAGTLSEKNIISKDGGEGVDYFPRALFNAKKGKRFEKDVDYGHRLHRDFETVDEYLDYINELHGSGELAKGIIPMRAPEALAARRIKGFKRLHFANYTESVLKKFGKDFNQEFAEKLGFKNIGALRIYANKVVKDTKGGSNLDFDDVIEILSKQRGFDPANDIKIPSGYVAINVRNPTTLANARTLKGSLAQDKIGLTRTKSGFNIGQTEMVELTPQQVYESAVAGDSNTMLIPKPVFDELKRVKGMFTGEKSDMVAQYYSKALGTWKQWATQLRLPFHTRNFYSGYFNMYLSGVPAKDLPRILALGVEFFGKLKLGKSREIAGMDMQNLLDVAEKLGAKGFGFLGADSMQEITSRMYKMRNPVKSRTKHPFKTLGEIGGKLGTTVEDHMRTGFWLYLLEKSGADYSKNPVKFMRKATKAAKEVRRVHFDYNDLTTFERKYIKQVFPFWTWMKKNVPFQARCVFDHPEKYAGLNRFNDVLFPYDNPETDHEYINQRTNYMRRVNFTKTGLDFADNNGGNVTYMHFDLPVGDLEKVSGNLAALESVLGGLNPVVTLGTLAASVTISSAAGRNRSKMVPAPVYIAFLPKTIRNMMGIGPMIDRQTGRTVVGMNYTARAMLRATFPFLSDWEKMFPAKGTYITPGSRKAAVASYLTGITFKQGDPNISGREAAFAASDLTTIIRNKVMAGQNPDKAYKETLKDMHLQGKLPEIN